MFESTDLSLYKEKNNHLYDDSPNNIYFVNFPFSDEEIQKYLDLCKGFVNSPIALINETAVACQTYLGTFESFEEFVKGKNVYFYYGTKINIMNSETGLREVRTIFRVAIV